MRFPLLLVSVVVAFGCSKKASPAVIDAGQPVSARPVQWEVMSFNGVAVLTSRGDERACEVRCVGRGSETVFQRDECISGKNDLRFVSSDCDVVLVLQDAPQVQGSVEATVVGTLWKPKGPPVPVRMHQVAKREGIQLAQSGKWFAWLGGTLDHAGQRPHYDAAGKGVELETLDGQKRVLAFAVLAEWVDTPPPAPPAVAVEFDAGVAPPTAEPPMALFQWVDDQGGMQIGTEEQIPAKYRKRAKPLNAELGVVKAEPMPDQPAPRVSTGYPTGLPPMPQPNKCEIAKARVDRVEAALKALTPPPECSVNPTIRTITGAWVFDQQERARCVGQRDMLLKAYEDRKRQFEAEKATAQEELRRVQVSGC